MQKMNNILELYGKDESFTQSEKNLLLDYNQKIRDAILAMKVEDQDESPIKNNHVNSIKKEEPLINKTFDKLSEVISIHVSENNSAPKSGSDKYQELFQIKKAEDLSEKLESTHIDNIQRAMGLNERILTQNELFKGDKNSFETTVQKLNGMNHFDEARTYLAEEVIPQFDWTNEDRIKKAQEFIKLVKRKFI
jgi:hypothetical protein